MQFTSNITLFPILLLVSSVIFLNSSYSKTVFQTENLKTHLRLKFNTAKDQLLIKTNRNELTIQTLNIDLFEQIVALMDKTKINDKYFVRRMYDTKNYPNTPATITLTLKHSNIETYAFYRNENKEHIIDFWDNTKDQKEEISAKVPRLDKKDLTVEKIQIKPKKTIKPAKIALTKKIENKINIPVIAVKTKEKINKIKESEFRDFRYGASLVWDYPALGLTLINDLEVPTKTPDYLYSLKDYELDGDEKNAHMQLTLNFYKKRKFGLMNKSINLYNSRYGEDKNWITNEFLKANTLIIEIQKNYNQKLFDSAVNILEAILAKTDEYDLQKALYRYLIQIDLNKNDHINAFEKAKKYFVLTQTNFDKEAQSRVVEVMLYSLAKLNLDNEIQNLLEDQQFNKIIPAQIFDSYISYLSLKKNEYIKVIKDFEKNEASYASDIAAPILFNVAESYFRDAKFEKSIKYFDQFIFKYSHNQFASYAQLRIALSYDFLDRDPKKILSLYEESINKSTLSKVRYEAKLRYVGMLLGRKKEFTKFDFEKIVFLDQSTDEKNVIDTNLQELLWLVRLRAFITSKEYELASKYLEAIPVDKMSRPTGRTFMGDGAEIVLGMIQNAFNNGDYQKCVKIWELYHNKYEEVVAKNPYLIFLVSESYLKLDILNLYSKNVDKLKSLKGAKLRTFPRWVDYKKMDNLDLLIDELNIKKLIALKEYTKAQKELLTLPNNIKENINMGFYQGLIDYHLEKYTKAIESFEKGLDNNSRSKLDENQFKLAVEIYAESLFKAKRYDKLKSSLSALIKDLMDSSKKSEKILNDFAKPIERFKYLVIESEFNLSKNNDYKEVINLINNFGKDYQDSIYAYRIKYLKALSLLKMFEKDKGIEILNGLVNDNDAPAYLREGAKTELNYLKLKQETI